MSEVVLFYLFVNFFFKVNYERFVNGKKALETVGQNFEVNQEAY